MKPFSFRLFTILLVSLIMSGCASVFTSKKQTLTLRTDDPNATISKAGSDEHLVEGSSQSVKIQRNLYPTQLIVNKDGYDPAYYTLYVTKRSPLYVMSWVPFGVFLAPLMERGDKSYSYDTNQRVFAPSAQKVIQREEGDRYIFVNKTSFDIEADSLSFYETTWNNYIEYQSHKHGRVLEHSQNRFRNKSEKIEIENTIFSDILNNILKERNFSDTIESKQILRNKTNTLYIDAEVSKVNITSVTRSFTAYNQTFYIGDIKIKWTIRDVYKKELLIFEDLVSTGEIVNIFSKKDQQNEIFFTDAFRKSLNNLLSNETVREFLKMSGAEKEVESLDLKTPMRIASKINEAVKASATIKVGDGHGSGFFINNEGYLLTNYHVVATAKKGDLFVITNDGKEHSAQIIRTNDYDDIALLKIDFENEFAFNVENGLDGEIGLDIYAIGTPNSIELGQTLSKGIISGERKNDMGQEFYQTDASVNRGNSGGPLVSSEGKIIGVVNAKLIGTGVEGIGFAIKINRVQQSLSLKFN
jgi:serine protease Do